MMVEIKQSQNLKLYDREFQSRFLLGSSRYPSLDSLRSSIEIAKPAMVTASLRRQGGLQDDLNNQFWNLIKELKVPVLPNTAGCHSPKEVLTTALMAREVFETEWIKLELIGDDYTLQPNTLELCQTAEQLLREGFKVLPYCTEDLIIAQRLVDVGCQVIMPWAAPIGTGKGPINLYALEILRDRIKVPIIIDAGIGKPSHACQVMEMGFDAVLLNTAVALANHPVAMAQSFSQAIEAGHRAYLAGTIAPSESAQASTPVIGTPFWHQS
ncbi:MAG: hypothetical protein RL212_39 [Pseudomonadota bacterium]|jgi:thiazole synthase